MKNNNITKAFAGVFLFAIVFVLSAIVGVKSADAYAFTSTMRIGSMSSEVFELQKTLNSTSCKVSLSGAGAPGFETTYFGPKTDAAVRCFQASRGLVADGIVGPVTRAVLSTLIVVVVPPVNLPPGCLPGYLFSSTTGQSCMNPSLPPGCIPGYLFSPTTGQSCIGTTPPPSSGGLQGNTGSIENAVFISSLNDEEVGEGENDVMVAGLRIEADNGSDIELMSVRLNFSEDNAGSDFDEYAEEVSIWFDGEEVAVVDADEFTSGNDFDQTITLDSGTIIQAGQTESLEVAVSGTENIDSSDIGDTWTVEFESIRFRDGDNAITTDSSTGDIGGPTRTFSFEEDSGSGDNDVELEVTETNDNPSERNVLVDDDSETNNVLLLAGEFLNNGNSDIDLQEITLRVSPSGDGDVSEIASSFTLIIDGDEIQTIDSDECQVSDDCDGSGEDMDVEYVFDDVDFMLDADDEVEFEIRADIRSIGGEFSEGDSLAVFIDADDIIAEDEDSDELTTGELEGTASGNEQSFYSVLP